MLSLICMSLMLGASLAQSRDSCCTPMQWEGYNDATVGFAGHEGKEAMIEGMKVSVDHTGKRVAASTFQYFEISSHSRMFKVIDNFATKKRIFVQNGTCQITSLQGEMMHNCIPEHHMHFGTYHIGAGEDVLEVDAWGIPTEGYTGELHLRTIRLGHEGCVPYQSRHIVIPGPEQEGHPAFASFHSYNRITPGIQDDSVFGTPEECRVVDHIELPLPVEEFMNAYHA